MNINAKKLERLAPFVAPFILLGMLAVALFVKSPLPAVVMVAFLWLLVLEQKGYIVYALPVFIITGIVFIVHPVFETGFLMNALLILMSLLPARAKVLGRWQIANRDGSFRTWLLPRGASEDVGSSVGDASIQLIAVATIAVALYTFVI